MSTTHKFATGEEKLVVQVTCPKDMISMSADEEAWARRNQLQDYSAEDVTTLEDRANSIERWELGEDFYATAVHELLRLQRAVSQRLESTLSEAMRGAVPGGRIVRDVPHFLGSEVDALREIHELWVLALRQRANARPGPWVIQDGEGGLVLGSNSEPHEYELYGPARDQAADMNVAHAALQEASGGRVAGYGPDEFSVVRQAQYKEGQLVWIATGDGERVEGTVVTDEPGSKVEVKQDGETQYGTEYYPSKYDRDLISKRRRSPRPKTPIEEEVLAAAETAEFEVPVEDEQEPEPEAAECANCGAKAEEGSSECAECGEKDQIVHGDELGR